MSAQLQADIDNLDSMDKEIDQLLKKKQNRKLSERDKVRLQELIDTREAIEVKYHLSAADTDGFDTIRNKVEAEVARAEARGQEVSATVYENAMVAAAEGMSAVNSSLDEQYDKEYALIQLIENSAERQQALDALNAKYNSDRRAAAMEYAQLMADVVMPVWQQSDIQEAKTQVGDLMQLLRQYSAVSTDAEKKSFLPQLNQLTASMDEGALTEYVGLLTQIQSLLDSGMSESELQAMFPDIEHQLQVMKHENNLKICVWINTYIGQKSPLFKEAKELGYLLKKPNGDVWQWDLWQAGMGIVDFTNPGAWKWYQSKLRHLLDQGVDCFKTDFGERIPTDVVYYDGSDPLRMHNYYTYLYNKCVWEVLEEYKGKNEACLFARSATVGGQKFPVHWGGDCSSNYSSMSESLRGGLSLCLSGFGFWSHDMSGFEGKAPADVYKRWAAFGLLSTHSRLHGSDSYRVPWLFSKEGEENGEESVAVVRKFSELKCTLMPYMFSTAVNTHRTGVPTMRAMVLEFPDDIPCEDLDRQYMLGDSLMVAPVFTKEGDVTYYLPEGKWTHLLSNEKREGGHWLRENYDFFSLPLFARENSIVAIGANNQQPDYDYGKDLTLHVFELSDKASAKVCDSKGNDMLSVSAVNENGVITFKFDGKAENLSVLLRNVENVKNVSGAEVEQNELGTVLKVNADLSDVVVTL